MSGEEGVQPPSDARRIWLGIRVPFGIALTFTLALFIANDMVDDWGRLSNGWANLVVFFEESLWPPDWSVLEAQSYPVCEEKYGFLCSTAYLGVIETLKIAFVATVFGMALSLPISLMASRNLNPPWLTYPARFILAASRSLPSIIWAIFFVILVGLGPFAGILAMTIYTIGYLGKLQYEAIEGMPSPPLEAADAMGLSWIEKSIRVVVLEAANGLISQAIFMFEYNFRHGTVIGIVGAGGIGYYINLYLKFLLYKKVIAYLIIIFVVVLLLDLLSIYARSLFTEEGDVARPKWRGIMLPPSMISKNR